MPIAIQRVQSFGLVAWPLCGPSTEASRQACENFIGALFGQARRIGDVCVHDRNGLARQPAFRTGEATAVVGVPVDITRLEGGHQPTQAPRLFRFRLDSIRCRVARFCAAR